MSPAREVDPRWKEFSASIRKGVLYVKMPAEKANLLVLSMQCLRALKEMGEEISLGNLHTQEVFLREQVEAATNPSVFISVTAENVREDIETLRSIEERDQAGILRSYREVLEKGLRNEPAVDWITRMGGPKADPFEGLAKDDVNREPEFLSIFDLEDV